MSSLQPYTQREGLTSGQNYHICGVQELEECLTSLLHGLSALDVSRQFELAALSTSLRHATVARQAAHLHLSGQECGTETYSRFRIVAKHLQKSHGSRCPVTSRATKALVSRALLAVEQESAYRKITFKVVEKAGA